MTEIKQIIPADGWRVIFKAPEGEISVPVICFALIYEQSIGMSIAGMVAHPGPQCINDCRNLPYFSHYMHKSQTGE